MFNTLLHTPFMRLLAVLSALSTRLASSPIVRLVQFTEALTIANTFIESETLQLYLHGVFVYLIMYGNFVSMARDLRQFTFLVSLVMLGTRCMYGICLFFPQNTSRIVYFDVIICLMMIHNLYRTTNCLGKHGNTICGIVAMISHPMTLFMET